MVKMSRSRSEPNFVFLVPEAGIEPARAFWTRGILSPLRLPISPLRQQRPHSGGTLTSRSKWVKVAAVGTHRLISGCACHRFDRYANRSSYAASIRGLSSSV